MRLACFYHAWADGRWTPIEEHTDALVEAGLTSRIGMVGSPSRRAQLRDFIAQHDVWVGDPVAEVDEGYEAVTLNAVRDYALEHDGAVLYAHTKGASANPVARYQSRWRRRMTKHVVLEWRENLAELERNDVVGCHWLTEAAYPGRFSPLWTPARGQGFFAGNFWMARCDYLRALPPVQSESRFQAELWIGLGDPLVFDILPRWPAW